MRQILRVALASGILGGGIPVMATAQAAPTDPSAPPPAFSESIVVSTSLAPETSDRATSSVTVIDKQEITARQTTNLADLLDTVPGLAIVQAGSPGQQTS